VNTLDIRRVVVLGHDGFVGRHVVATIGRRSPAVEVVGRSQSDLDLTRRDEALALRPYCDDVTAFVVCAGVKRQLGDTLDALEQNLQIAVNLARLFEASLPRRVVYFSSAAVYGEQLAHARLTEETPVQPTSLYGVGKVASELTLKQVLEPRSERCSFVALRPPLIYGPGDRSHSYGPAGFVRAAARRAPIELWGDGTERRGFTYVEDVAELVWHLAGTDVSGPLNVTAGTSASFHDVVEILRTLTPDEIELRSRPRSRPAVDHVYAPGRVQALFPSFAFTPLRTGVALTYEAAEEASA
jgi:UDP-glucose 4-epimerase